MVHRFVPQIWGLVLLWCVNSPPTPIKPQVYHREDIPLIGATDQQWMRSNLMKYTTDSRVANSATLPFCSFRLLGLLPKPTETRRRGYFYLTPTNILPSAIRFLCISTQPMFHIGISFWPASPSRIRSWSSAWQGWICRSPRHCPVRSAGECGLLDLELSLPSVLALTSSGPAWCDLLSQNYK